MVKMLALHQDGVGSSLGVNKGGLSLLFALFYRAAFQLVQIRGPQVY